MTAAGISSYAPAGIGREASGAHIPGGRTQGGAVPIGPPAAGRAADEGKPRRVEKDPPYEFTTLG
jgi:hypothetical protein